MALAPSFYLGAYASSPTLHQWDIEKENAYLTEIQTLPYLKGLEIPFMDNSLSTYNQFITQCTLENHLVTALPAMMQSLRENPYFGLASTQTEGRRAAINLVKKIHEFCQQKNIYAIHIPSAPRGQTQAKTADAECFYQSMQEIASWNWGSILVNVEHCDAWQQNYPVDKGFLPFTEELQVMESINKKFQLKWGVLVNWARSVLETHQTENALHHLKLATEKKLLKGFFFSGICAESTIYGNWRDTHAPFTFLQAESLLNQNEVIKCLSILEAMPDLYMGIKFQLLPQEKTHQERIEMQRQALTFLKESCHNMSIESNNFHH